MKDEKEIIGTVEINGEARPLEWIKGDGINNFGHSEVGGVDFDGHRVIWSFGYEAKTYLKESELSGDQWRKGGYIRVIRNGVCVWESFCREPLNAASMMYQIVSKCVHFEHWNEIKPGKKCYYQDVPSVVKSVLEGGDVVVETEDGSNYPAWAYEQEQMNRGDMTEADREWTNTMKDHATSDKFYWHRNSK